MTQSQSTADFTTQLHTYLSQLRTDRGPDEPLSGASEDAGVSLTLAPSGAVTAEISRALAPREEDRDRLSGAVAEAATALVTAIRGGAEIAPEAGEELLRSAQAVFADGQAHMEEQLRTVEERFSLTRESIQSRMPHNPTARRPVHRTPPTESSS